MTVLKKSFGELWYARELLLELAFRDIKVRYKQTSLGIAWALFTPLVMMTIFTLVFSRVAKIDTGSIPYPIFVYCGLLPWQFFANCLKGSVESLTRNSRLVTKIYMPREVFPLAQIISSGVDFLIAGTILGLMMVWYQIPLTAAALYLPLIIMIQLILTAGIALFLSMANLFYRDVKYIAEVFILLWMFVTPVLYPLPKDVQWLGVINPVAPIIEGYRTVLIEGQAPEMLPLAITATVAVGWFLIVLRWFDQSEYLFAENI